MPALTVGDRVDEAARRQSALVAFPETCNYLHSGPTWTTAEPPNGPTLSALRGKAAEHGIAERTGTTGN